ncbi:hypothetical protein [Bacteroides ovatus]|uniref:hypothetical protein n=1 Tax=Bacteroides ovatus TaxID=28116 RepID=UPI00189918CB|nr:hypothetical protein [Bacteroides ovatus]MDC2621541.1 hypothetical protein [Bacteroides ovatus]MDC2637373.1 hypothetical protein [Bacteroides ovatus]MDC2651160.1 hypothetical protein [Bacteroides ovatus]
MTMGLFFKEFNVDKILESGAFKVWEEIKVGKEVFLELKSKDKEKDTVSVKVEKKVEILKGSVVLEEIKGTKGIKGTVEVEKSERTVRSEKIVFGELPEKESKVISDLLKQGWDQIFEAYICKKDEDAPLYDQRISIAVYIKEK